MKKEIYRLDQKTVDIVRHIFDARIDNATSRYSYLAYCNARDIFEYALAGNIEALEQFDYLKTKEDDEND